MAAALGPARRLADRAVGRRGADRDRPPRRPWRPRLQRSRRWSTTRCSTGCEQFVPLAPLHQPNNLAPIREIRARYPQIPQVACFDTAFHRRHPEVADRYAIPDRWYCRGRSPLRLPRPVLRVCRRPAARARPCAGRGAHRRLPPGLGCVDVRDPWRPQHGQHHGLHRRRRPAHGHAHRPARPRRRALSDPEPGLRAQRMSSASSTMRAGSRACPGVSNDMRDLEASDAPGAKLAIDYFVYRIVRETGALAAAMGGIDGPGLHRRHRRAQCLGPRGRGRAPGLARRRAGRRPPTPPAAADDLHAAEPSCRSWSSRPTRS